MFLYWAVLGLVAALSAYGVLRGLRAGSIAIVLLAGLAGTGTAVGLAVVGTLKNFFETAAAAVSEGGVVEAPQGVISEFSQFVSGAVAAAVVCGLILIGTLLSATWLGWKHPCHVLVARPVK